MPNEIPHEERKQIDKFLFSLGFTKEQYWESYRNWYKGGRGWWPLHQGGTGQMLALMWYQHTHRPESKEWRPSIIIKALRAEVEKMETVIL